MSEKHVYYGQNEGTHVFKLTGELRFDVGSALEQALATFEKATSVNKVILDLREVTLLDSTILGLISRIVAANHDETRIVWVLNEDIDKTLRQVGFDQYFTIVFNGFPTVMPAQCEEFHVADESKASLEQRVRRAHENLMELNVANEKKFQSVVDNIKKH